MAKGYKHSRVRIPPEPYLGSDVCSYGCGQAAQWQFRKGKLCCSKSFNSCPEKRRRFSEELDHKEYARRSLETRQRLGITKSSQVKAAITRKANGHYDRLAQTMQQHWTDHPWSNDLRCPLLSYKGLDLSYQGSYEFSFLQKLESEHGIEWISDNVRRGPAISYNDAGVSRTYLPDFLIGQTIYEIKSGYTWNRSGSDEKLEQRNRNKLNSALNSGYNVILVLDHIEVKIN